MKKIIAIVLICVFLIGCEDIFRMMGLIEDIPDIGDIPFGENFSYSISTDNSTYIIGSTVTITCEIKNNDDCWVKIGYSCHISNLFNCEIWKVGEKVWPFEGDAVCDEYLEEAFKAREKKDYTYYWIAISTPGTYTVKFSTTSTDIEIQ